MLLSLCSKVCFWEDQIFIEELLSKILLTIWSLWSADISLSAMLNMFTNTSQLIDNNKKTKEISKNKNRCFGSSLQYLAWGNIHSIFSLPSKDIFFCWEIEEEVEAILHFLLGWSWMMALMALMIMTMMMTMFMLVLNGRFEANLEQLIPAVLRQWQRLTAPTWSVHFKGFSRLFVL